LITSIKVVEKLDDGIWSEFLVRNTSSVFQTPIMSRVWDNSRNYKTIKKFLIESGKLTALFISHMISEGDGLKGKFSTRAVIPGGIVHNTDENGISFLLNDFEETVKKDALYSQIRLLWSDPIQEKVLRDWGWEYEQHLSYHIDLGLSEEQLISEMKTDKRRAIKRAQKKNLTFLEGREISDIRAFYLMLEETYIDAGVPLADFSFFESIFNLMVSEERAKFFLAKVGDEYAGGRLVLFHNDTVLDFYAADNNELRTFYPNEFLVWNILQWSKKNGYSIFDFYGAGKPSEEYGVREWKKRFGGNEVTHGRFIKIHQPKKLKMGKGMYKMIKWFG